MNTGEKPAIKIRFPFGVYLRQLFSADTYVRYINPFSFWRRYRINHLEICSELSNVKYLESCHKLDCLDAKYTNIVSNRDYEDISTNSFCQQAKLNTIYVSQPRIKLKYRGVSYYTKDILNINIDVVEKDPSIVRANNLKRANDSDNANISKKSGTNQ